MSDLLAAALWYAKHGYTVFPLQPGTKDPLPGSRGVYDATTDLARIRRWWAENPRYNIGIHCGPSGLLSIDLDSYKEKYAGAELIFPRTITAISAHGGSHMWYKMPQCKRYGNSRGTLPPGIDVRGFGGYLVVPPSILVEDGAQLPYTFAPGCRPTDLEPAPLPAEIVAILDAAEVARQALPVNFTEGSLAIPELSRWELPADVLELVAAGAPKGERSEADYRVILALCRDGADDDEIRAVFTHFAIGEKYREKGTTGNKYLAYSIGKARSWLLDHPPDPKLSLEKLASLRAWVRSPACLCHLRQSGIRRVADLIPLLDAIGEVAMTRRTSRIVTTVRDLADRCAIAAMTVHRRLGKLTESGLLTTTSDPFGTLIDLSPLLTACHNEVDLSDTPSPKCGSVSLRSTFNDDFFADHRGDDAFTSYPYAYAVKRRQAPTVLMRSLGPAALLLWDALLDGGTVKELAEATGLTVASVRATLKRFDQAGLLVIWQEGRAKVYELHPNAWDLLEEKREHMVTAGVGQLHTARNSEATATYAQWKLQGRMPLDARQKAKLIARRDKADEKAAATYESLMMMGINPYAHVRSPRPPRTRIKIDHGEEWVSMYRPIYEKWQDLAPLPYSERYRLLGFAGYERKEVDAAKRMAAKMGRGPRQFVGVGESRGEVAAS